MCGKASVSQIDQRTLPLQAHRPFRVTTTATATCLLNAVCRHTTCLLAALTVLLLGLLWSISSRRWTPRQPSEGSTESKVANSPGHDFRPLLLLRSYCHNLPLSVCLKRRSVLRSRTTLKPTVCHSTAAAGESTESPPSEDPLCVYIYAVPVACMRSRRKAKPK